MEKLTSPLRWHNFYNLVLQKISYEGDPQCLGYGNWQVPLELGVGAAGSETVDINLIKLVKLNT